MYCLLFILFILVGIILWCYRVNLLLYCVNHNINKNINGSISPWSIINPASI